MVTENNNKDIGYVNDVESNDLKDYEVVLRDEHEPRDLFCQMDILKSYNDDVIWKEIHRWVKFEEVLEEKGKRWSKPHVSSLHMQCLTELHTTIASNPCLLDAEATSMYDIADLILDYWRQDGTLSNLLWNHVRAVLLKRHKHVHVRRKQVIRHTSKAQEVQTKLSTFSIKENDENPSFEDNGRVNVGFESSQSSISDSKEGSEDGTYNSPAEHLAFGAEPNDKFKRKIPFGAEVVNIMIGEVEELKNRLSAFVRLNKAKDVGNITEVSLPTRFLFVLLVPKGQLKIAVEMGRCLGTLMTDEIFREVAYRSTEKVEILSAVQEFTSNVTVLPPGCWDPQSRIEPPEVLPTKESRKSPSTMIPIMEEHEESHSDPTLERTGRLFGGLIQDIKRKLKWYKSDFTDALHVQCFASFIYLFLATLTPNVTFGGLLGKATDQYMGTMECILAASVSGIIFALFSGQPLNILGSTGPMLVLESILYHFCKDYGWDFLSVRVWVGLWTALFLLLLVVFDLSSLVRYITRFTEESFACLIAFIFIYEAFAKLIEIESHAPVHFNTDRSHDSKCLCLMFNFSSSDPNLDADIDTSVTSRHVRSVNFDNDMTTKNSHDSQPSFELMKVDNCTLQGGMLIGSGCHLNKYVPDVFFLSILLFIGTCVVAFGLKGFRNSRFCPNMVRQTVSDFGVLIAIVSMVLLDVLLGVPTPKLTVPSEFKPTRSDRGWFINPIGSHNPWWIIIASAIPAILATILIFMDQQITSVIVNRKENKLKKGGGYHLDLLVLAVVIIILSLLGLPWYVAATVTAIAHVMSLKKESECTAPGEKSKFLGVREQRVTALLVGVFSGLAVLITSVLKFIPMPVLYGVFFYMGVSALKGMQLIQRICIMFMPQKYQPDYIYLRHVPLPKVHLYTVIQTLCLAILWVVKSIKAISIIFPVMVLATCFVRKALDYMFRQYELKWLDELLPNAHIEICTEKSEKSDDVQLQKTKTTRSLSVPAYTSTFQSQPLELKTSLPFIGRAISNETLKASSYFGNPSGMFERKISLLSLPAQPTYGMDGCDESKPRDCNCKRDTSDV